VKIFLRNFAEFYVTYNMLFGSAFRGNHIKVVFDEFEEIFIEIF
jgi:hypothetical protein